MMRSDIEIYLPVSLHSEDIRDFAIRIVKAPKTKAFLIISLIGFI